VVCHIYASGGLVLDLSEEEDGSGPANSFVVAMLPAMRKTHPYSSTAKDFPRPCVDLGVTPTNYVHNSSLLYTVDPSKTYIHVHITSAIKGGQ
jgi:hypothetical protein